MTEGADRNEGVDDRGRSPFRPLWVFASVLTGVGLLGSAAGQFMSAAVNYSYSGTQPFTLTLSQILWSVSPTLLSVGVFAFGFGVAARAVLSELASRDRAQVGADAEPTGSTVPTPAAPASRAHAPSSFAPPPLSGYGTPGPLPDLRAPASRPPSGDDHERFRRPGTSHASASERV